MKLNEAADATAKPTGKLYVDMDGVIADFVKGITKILDHKYDERRYKSDPRYRKQMWKAVADYSAKGGKLWLELPVMHDAMVLWNYIKDHNPEILSATGKPGYGADPQKREWIKTKIDADVKVNLVRQAKEKATYAREGDILIDDQPKAIDPWVAAGGTGILHTSAAKTIEQLKKLGY